MTVRRILACWPILLLIGLPFFFMGGPGFHSARSFVHLWNLGHILYFALFALWLLRLAPLQHAHLTTGYRLIILFFCPLLIGAAIEYLQYLTNGRSPSLGDILRNQLGVSLALLFQKWSQYQGGLQRLLLLLLRGLVLLLACVALLPLLIALWDEHQARRQFPLLADFESPHELSRWLYPRQLRQEGQIVRHGRKAARVQLSTAKYSGIALFHFPKDWRGYRQLHFSVYNPLQVPLELNCRIHDMAHQRRYGPYEDRFNMLFLLRPGWNDLSVSLQQVAAAPRGRAMDMANITGFGLFVVEQKEAIAIFLDHVYLR
ncbi:MAG: VanZ family protein [Desulfobulbaceae bacterium]|nr:VanZ family protein [Desulfobulbaceae bacterium]